MERSISDVNGSAECTENSTVSPNHLGGDGEHSVVHDLFVDMNAAEKESAQCDGSEMGTKNSRKYGFNEVDSTVVYQIENGRQQDGDENVVNLNSNISETHQGATEGSTVAECVNKEWPSIRNEEKVWKRISANIEKLTVTKYAQERGRKDMMEVLLESRIKKLRQTKKTFDDNSLRRTVFFYSRQ